eukprot:146593_1
MGNVQDTKSCEGTPTEVKRYRHPQNEGLQVPERFLDPITNKIMAKPTMIMSSMKVYDDYTDDITINKWIKSKRFYDPMTGIPMSVGGWPLLLRPLRSLQKRIQRFLQKYPAFTLQVLNEKDESIHWESLFQIHESKIKEKYLRLAQEQSDLTRKARQIFAPLKLETGDEFTSENKNDDGIGIDYDESIILSPDIPIVCFMGPSRNGKSTIVNDMLGVKDACATSSKADVPLTKGAWIAMYSTQNQDEDEQKEPGNANPQNAQSPAFYVLDMEGLSHEVTKFTKRLFYACYATSNLIVWNDKNVASDEFKGLMKELKNEMQAVAESNSKPAFLYLKRDAGDYDFDPHDTFDEYINKSPSFEWFRTMNIFSSLSAYEIDRPSRDRSNKKGALNFHSKPENRELLVPLIDTLIKTATESRRFASNMCELKQQVQHINKSTALSITKKLISDNPILRVFLIAPNGSDRFRDMVYVACEFDWEHDMIEKKFNEELDKLRASETDSTKMDPRVIAALIHTKNEIYERVKNKIEQKQYGKNLGMFTGAGVGGILFIAGVATSGIGLGAIMVGSLFWGGIGYGIGWTTGKSVEITERIITHFADGNYMKFSLGKTMEEMKHGEEKPKEKTEAEEWDDDEWDAFTQCFV